MKVKEMELKILIEFRKYCKQLAIPWYNDSLEAYKINKEKIKELDKRIKELRK